MRAPAPRVRRRRDRASGARDDPRGERRARPRAVACVLQASRWRRSSATRASSCPCSTRLLAHDRRRERVGSARVGPPSASSRRRARGCRTRLVVDGCRAPPRVARDGRAPPDRGRRRGRPGRDRAPERRGIRERLPGRPAVRSGARQRPVAVAAGARARRHRERCASRVPRSESRRRVGSRNPPLGEDAGSRERVRGGRCSRRGRPARARPERRCVARLHLRDDRAAEGGRAHGDDDATDDRRLREPVRPRARRRRARGRSGRTCGRLRLRRRACAQRRVSDGPDAHLGRGRVRTADGRARMHVRRGRRRRSSSTSSTMQSTTARPSSRACASSCAAAPRSRPRCSSERAQPFRRPMRPRTTARRNAEVSLRARPTLRTRRS